MWRKAAMSVCVREAIGVLAGPRGFGDTRESWLAKASRKTGVVSFRMMRSLWNGEIDEANHWAAREVKRQAAELAGRSEAIRLAGMYENIAEGMRERDEDFHREDIAALVRAARILRGDRGTGIDGA